jgi:DNA polymerase-3 subunit alpha
MTSNHTYYSYKYGTISPEKLLQLAQQNDYEQITLTDINSTSATLDFVRLSTKYNIKPIVGIDYRNGAEQKYIGIAKNNEGYTQLNTHLSLHLHVNEPFLKDAPDLDQCYIIYPYSKAKRKLKDNEFIGVRISELTRLPFSVWKNSNQLVILQPNTFSSKKEFNAHRLLRAIDNNMLLSQLPKSEEANPDEIMCSRAELMEQYREHPQIIKNTLMILDNCSIQFDFTSSKNKQNYGKSPEEDWQLIESLCAEGLKFRYKNPSSVILQRLEKEMKMIKQLNFAAYFLINWDLVKYARSKDFYYVGRGSGANSIVAYLLRITDVDPIELNLYFERFINPSRTSPPDFDIDFSSKDRNQITQYIFDTHSYKNTALVGNYNTFQYKSVLRELGKVFGLPAEEISKVQASKNVTELDDIGKLIIKYSKHIHGLPSHIGVHSSGIVISDSPIYNFTATNMPPKGFPTTHFSMLEAEDVGLAKFDILGQRGLGKIKDAVQIIKQNRNIEVDIHNIEKLKQDKRIKKLIKTGDALGCFYVESPAMRNLLKKLEADDYISLVAASSIIRPGVSQSGMMREYILRYQDPSRREKARTALPELYEILDDTYGIMVYQEDVIKVAHQFAGLTLTEADVLRRGMSGKYRSRDEFTAIKESFFNNCKAKNYSESVTNEIWRQIESFAGYAFPKGHSASYAVESFQALYLKAYFPIEYMTATINNGGGFFRKETYIHEAKLHGATIEAPCVNTSDANAVVIGDIIWLGLKFINGMEYTTINNILNDRERNGPFLSFENFVDRVSISLDQLRILVRIEAFKFTSIPKITLLWKAQLLLGNDKKTEPTISLFQNGAGRRTFKIPELIQNDVELAYDQIELLNLPLNCTHFELVEELPNLTLTSKDLRALLGKKVDILGHLIHRRKTNTKGKHPMSFGTFLDLEGQWLDTVQFPNVNAKYPFQGYGCYVITGVVKSEMGVIMIETQKLEKLKPRSIEEDNPRMTSGIVDSDKKSFPKVRLT